MGKIPCPAICRDEIKEGLVHADGGGTPAWGSPIADKTFEVFYGALRLMLSAGVTLVAEAAFRRSRSEPELLPLIELAETRMLLCSTSQSIARDLTSSGARFAERAKSDPLRRLSHPDDHILEAIDSGQLPMDSFHHLDLPIPVLTVDTTDGYDRRSIRLWISSRDLSPDTDRRTHSAQRGWRRVGSHVVAPARTDVRLLSASFASAARALPADRQHADQETQQYGDA